MKTESYNPTTTADMSGMFSRTAERLKTLEIRGILMEGHAERERLVAVKLHHGTDLLTITSAGN